MRDALVPGPDTGWLVDAHVHLYDSFDLDRFLSSAANNLAAGARTLGLPGSTPGCLLLMETESQARLGSLRGLETAGGWRIRPRGEAISVVAEKEGRPSVALVAGRQVATREGLEVLAIGCEDHPGEDQAIEHVLGTVSRAGALPIIPWGFGKWWSSRGALVERLVKSRPVPTLFLGDSAGRWRRGHTPRLLRLAESYDVWNLPGSDPLPLRWQVDRAGSYGFLLPCVPDANRPAAQIVTLLRETTAQPRTFGARDRLLRFVRAQVGIRLRNVR